MTAVPNGFRPMLAYRVEDFLDVRYPVLASAKLDGIRAVAFDLLLSRTLKPIRNSFIQGSLREVIRDLDMCDGELMLQGASPLGQFADTAGAIMSQDGEPDFTYWIFDRYDATDSFMRRYMAMEQDIKRLCHPRVKIVPHAWIESAQDLIHFEVKCLEDGHEGSMIRDPKGLYKRGRSTLREGGLGKIKRFFDAEAEVTGYGPLMRNKNEPVRNALGLAQRSHDQANKVADNLLGYLAAKTAEGVPFEIGTGFTERQRITLWRDRSSLVGRMVRYKHLPYGAKEKPRHPVFLGFRDKEDMQ